MIAHRKSMATKFKCEFISCIINKRSPYTWC